MGVQKSRKSIKYTKYSRLIKISHKDNTYKNKQKIQHVYSKDFFRKTNVFLLKKLENNKSLFFN